MFVNVLPKCHREFFLQASREGYEFIRKGQIGDSATVFTGQMNDLFDEMIHREFPEGIPEWLIDYCSG